MDKCSNVVDLTAVIANRKMQAVQLRRTDDPSTQHFARIKASLDRLNELMVGVNPEKFSFELTLKK